MISKRALREAKVALMKNAGPLTDVKHLRYQAVFTMGAAGSGKSFVANNKWLNYLPDPSGNPNKYKNLDAWEERIEEGIPLQMRSLSNLTFEDTVEELEDKYGITIVPGNGTASIPFELYTYDSNGQEHKVDPKNWETELPPEIYKEVKGLQEVVFSTPIHEVPSYWRQVNPDLYKEELSGYLETQPGYVHEMSSDMSKAYFQAAIESGDPLLVDGTGSNLKKMKQQIKACKDRGYRVTLVWIYVPLTVNMIRNAVRARKVLPDIITKQFKSIGQNFQALSTAVDKTDFVDNRFDNMDKKNWKKHCAAINQFFKDNTAHETLYEYMMNTSEKAEVQGDYAFVQHCGQNPILDKEDKINRLKRKRKELNMRREHPGKVRNKRKRTASMTTRIAQILHEMQYIKEQLKNASQRKAYNDPCNGTSYYGERYDVALEGLEECHGESIRENKVEDAFDYLQQLSDISDDFDFADAMSDASSEYRLNSAEYELLKWYYDNEM